MQSHHTNVYQATRLMAVAARNIWPRPTQGAREERTHLPQFYRRERRPYINDQPLPRIGLVRTWLETCARRSPYSFLKKPSNGRGWLMPGREVSGDRIHLQFPIEFQRRSKRLSRKCWSMRRYVLCILNFMLPQWWSLIKSDANQKNIRHFFFYFMNIIVF